MPSQSRRVPRDPSPSRRDDDESAVSASASAASASASEQILDESERSTSVARPTPPSSSPVLASHRNPASASKSQKNGPTFKDQAQSTDQPAAVVPGAVQQYNKRKNSKTAPNSSAVSADSNGPNFKDQMRNVVPAAVRRDEPRGKSNSDSNNNSDNNDNDRGRDRRFSPPPAAPDGRLPTFKDQANPNAEQQPQLQPQHQSTGTTSNSSSNDQNGHNDSTRPLQAHAVDSELESERLRREIRRELQQQVFVAGEPVVAFHQGRKRRMVIILVVLATLVVVGAVVGVVVALQNDGGDGGGDENVARGSAPSNMDVPTRAPVIIERPTDQPTGAPTKAPSAMPILSSRTTSIVDHINSVTFAANRPIAYPVSGSSLSIRPRQKSAPSIGSSTATHWHSQWKAPLAAIAWSSDSRCSPFGSAQTDPRGTTTMAGSSERTNARGTEFRAIKGK